MEKKLKRIGIMGGTFDPIHMGHLILGEKAYEQLSLDKVLFMPSGNPPHKKNRAGRATDQQRVEMVRVAIADNPHFELSLEEMHEEGYTYTYHTLERLNNENHDTEYYFIIGADSLYTFDTWKEPERICQACTLVVATRDHTPKGDLDRKIREVAEQYHGRLIRLDTMNIDVSSKLLRSWHRENKSLRYYVPLPVISYIEKNGIYISEDAGKGLESDGKI
nr:nicotinate-nucleotide adenylyltransferase [uncultured Blautia sp.]